jgi:hypothetical protein
MLQDKGIKKIQNASSDQPFPIVVFANSCAEIAPALRESVKTFFVQSPDIHPRWLSAS